MSKIKLLLYGSITLVCFLVGGPLLALLAILVMVYLHKKRDDSSNKVVASAVGQEIPTSSTNEVPSPIPTDNRFDAKSDFKSLLTIYKTLPKEDEVDVKKLLTKVNPDATEHKCPYCGTEHDFSAVRARKCPVCGEKMVVRQRKWGQPPFLGLPTERSVCSSPYFSTVLNIHASEPYGTPFDSERSRVTSSSLVCGVLRSVRYSLGSSIGHGDNSFFCCTVPLSLLQTLDHCQSSACRTRLALSAFRST